jgi:type VI secretion system protein ImpK
MAATPVRKPVRPSLLELTSGVFSLIISLRRAADLGQEAALRQRITNYFAEFEREAQDQGCLREDVDKARFALVAFLDETVLDLNWSQHDQWRDRPLQLDMFGERRAGQRFFDEMAQLRRQGEAKREVVEVYHQCLNLGFQGQYRITGEEQFVQLKTELDRYLGYDPRDRRELKLSPHGKRRDSATSLAADTFPFWRIAAVIGVVLIVLYFVFTFSLGNATEQALSTISKPQP